jgi:uncharacterized BrkB/YihY/UPF0761 family membrane protein
VSPVEVANPAPEEAASPVRGIRRLVGTGMIAVPSFFRHRGTQLAAAISYRVLFSLVPFLALALSLLDLVLTAEAEKNIDEWLASLAPGDANLEESLTRILSSTGTAASITGIVALAGLFGFLFLVYLVASAIVFGAEVVRAWPEAARPSEDEGPSMTVRERIVDAVRSLVRAPRDPLP